MTMEAEVIGDGAVYIDWPVLDGEWHLRWFSHYIRDDGQSDRELLDSFEQYVRSVEDTAYGFASYEEQERHIGGTLMGAQDRWRWNLMPQCWCQQQMRVRFIGH